MLLLCCCSQKEQTTSSAIESTGEVNSLLQEYLDDINKFESPIRQFGSPTSFIDMNDNFVVGILYPETEIDMVNSEITTWIDAVVSEYKAEISSRENMTYSAELTVAYESYHIGDKTASIKFSGIYMAEYLAHPVYITKTFNIDIENNTIIKVADMFGEQNIGTFIEKTIQKAEIEQNEVDDHLLDNAIFTLEGIEIIFNRGDYHPMSSGTVIVSFTYDEIDELLKPGFDHTKNPEKESVDVVVPTPEKIPDTSPQLDKSKPMIALTFDDGPSKHTDRLLDIFSKHGGKGTFFVVGNLIDSKKDTLLRIANEGHEIGNHSWDHRQLTKLSDQEITDQIMMTRAKIFDITGVDTTIMRPPYGACNDDVKAIGSETGVAFVNWSIDTLDWKNKDVNAIYNEIIANAKDGDIVLCHDLHKTTVDAMEIVIPKLIDEGYQLVTITELMQYSDSPFEAGKMYYRQ